MIVLQSNIMGNCPGGFCEYLLQFSEVLVVLLLADGFIFLVTLIPPLFSWKNKKPDSKSRIFFAVFACLTFYFWLSILAINSLYCFGFLAFAGPCNNSLSPARATLPPSEGANLTAPGDSLCLTHSTSALKKITLVNCLIIIILIIVIAANVNEGDQSILSSCQAMYLLASCMDFPTVIQDQFCLKNTILLPLYG